MNRYTYKCKRGHHFETNRRIDRFSQMRCSGMFDGRPCEEKEFSRVYKPVNVIFKGKGFYSTDNKK